MIYYSRMINRNRNPRLNLLGNPGTSSNLSADTTVKGRCRFHPQRFMDAASKSHSALRAKLNLFLKAVVFSILVQRKQLLTTGRAPSSSED